MKRLMEKYDNYALSVSATTRAPRPQRRKGNTAGDIFPQRKEFEELILEDALIEYAPVCYGYYGTPKAYVGSLIKYRKRRNLGKLKYGALKVKKKMPNTLLLL